jgi:hypothetical protein
MPFWPVRDEGLLEPAVAKTDFRSARVADLLSVSFTASGLSLFGVQIDQ